MDVRRATALGSDVDGSENGGADLVIHAPSNHLMSLGGRFDLRVDGHLPHDLKLGRWRRLCDSGVPHEGPHERNEGGPLSHSPKATSLFSVKRDVARRSVRFFVGCAPRSGEEGGRVSRIKSVPLPTVVPMLTNTFHPIGFR